GTSKCKGPRPCNGTSHGSLRCGTAVTINGNSTFAWRHWGCVTAKQFHNMKESFEEAEELDGFEDLKPEDQERVKKAFDVGHVADEDIPDSARKPEADDDGAEDDDEKPKKKASKAKGGSKKKKAAKDEDDDEAGSDGEPKEKKKKVRKRTVAASLLSVSPVADP
ncbi:poly polymerase and DNA-ligase Zn-finger region-domain-containing protein, partial [Rhodotorula diobovata]